ncbi:ATP-dependent DNA helicase [Salix suchowensis]|nr:ATP-dependent DNA helicase [Salix suchowensis]
MFISSHEESRSQHQVYGGHHAFIASYQELQDFIVDGPAILDNKRTGLVFKGVYSDVEVLQFPASVYIHIKADITSILPFLTAGQCVSVARKHGIVCGFKCSKAIVMDMAQDHSCVVCYLLTYVFELKTTRKFADKQKQDAKEKNKAKENETDQDTEPTIFPPSPLSKYAIKNIVTACAKKMEASAIAENGCAVCGQLIPNTELSRIKAIKNLLHVLEAPGVTRALRKKPTDPIKFISVDIKHPICIYYAGSDEIFQPAMPADKRMRTVTSNPVACARFFKFMVDMFISDILGFDNDQCKGIYGDVEGYYGTVEQQGRLTLHLHAMVWIRGSLSPQEIRDNILNPEGSWKQKLIKWLENCHVGEFLTGSQNDITTSVNQRKENNTYVDPTLQVPDVPPYTSECSCVDETCSSCITLNNWWSEFSQVTDDIILQSNVHSCDRYLKKDGTQNKAHVYKGCKDNKWGKCKARFPRPVVQQTTVNDETGSITLKKHEAWINTFTPLISYIIRSNTDVTSMLSGTAVKAVVAYVSDYITKCGLKTHVVFECIQAVLSRNPEILNNTGVEAATKARQIMTKSYRLVPVFDYVYRPETLDTMCLYDWVTRCKRVKPTASKKKNSNNSTDCDDYVSSEDDLDEEPDDTDNFLVTSKRLKQVLLDYQADHPLASTHKCSLLLPTNKRAKFMVPNFMGIPPRRDQGDREYYCSAMLALFVPWRSGKELKSSEETWDEAFLKHTFSEEHSRIMNNFNLRYECLDAKDDFRTEMKTNANANVSFPFDDDYMTSGEKSNNLEGVLPNADDMMIQLESEKMSSSAIKRQKGIKDMKALMQNSNWSKPLPISKGLSDGDTPVEIPFKSAREWRQLVMTLRQETIDARKQTGFSGNPAVSSHSHDFDNVKVVDKSYLESSYIPKIHKQLVVDCSTIFSLNKEQNRAFSIVANHSVTENSGQLKMYIGGMGGTGKSQVLKALVHLFSARNESEKLLVVAPTASAACLLPGGVTYHSAFAMNFAVSKSSLKATKERLEGVSYVFFDEISMCSARDLHNISVRMCLALNAPPGLPFGGLNMIFAGDFAQLPPPIGGENSKLTSKGDRKHKGDENDGNIQARKRLKSANFQNTCQATSIDQFIPVGCEWNDNSCAYDTVITLLYNMWLDRPSSLTEFLEMSDPLFVTLIKSFQNVQYNQARLTDLREYMRQCLQIQHPDEFEYGRYASITSLLNVLFTAKDNVVNLQYECGAGHLGTRLQTAKCSFIISLGADTHDSVKAWVSNMGTATRCLCLVCSEPIICKHVYEVPPYFLAFEFSGRPMYLDRKINLTVQNNTIPYFLKCIVYYGRSHFIGRYIDHRHRTWIYDGMSNGGFMEYDKQHVDNDFSACRSMDAIAAIYVRSSKVHLATG